MKIWHHDNKNQKVNKIISQILLHVIGPGQPFKKILWPMTRFKLIYWLIL